MTTAENVFRDICAIREKAPVILSITNYVVTNTTANALLAIGASPIMSHAVEEMEDIVAISGAVVINLGTIAAEYVAAMGPAWTAADAHKVPVVLDPVGAGASRLRTETPLALLRAHHPFIIRGNGSEILTIAGASGAAARGVDSAASSNAAASAARNLARGHACAVAVSGETDIVTDGEEDVRVHGGSPLMPRVTGLGCTATALCAAFAAVDASPLEAACNACVTMKVAGELAAEKAEGPGTLQLYFYDALYNLTEARIAARFKAER